jgi:hypothetical protein
MSNWTIEPVQEDDPLAPVPGARRVWIDGRPGGWLMPTVDEAALGGDIAPTSKPGKTGDDPQLWDASNVLSFSDYCARHLIQTYPRSTRKPQ